MFGNPASLTSGLKTAQKAVLPILLEGDSSKILATLQTLDTHGLLERRGRHLSELLHHLFNRLKLKPDEFTLYEVGAHHHRLFRRDMGGPYDAGIAQFYALNKDTLTHNYYAFDPNAKHVVGFLNFDMKQFLEGSPKIYSFTKKYPRPDKDFFEKLIIAIESISIPTFDNLKVAAEKTQLENKTPVFFSNNVFNDPKLKYGLPFWKLRGIHCHRVNFCEGLINYGGGYSKELEAASDHYAKPWRTDPLYFDKVILINFDLNPQKHLDHFREKFGIDAEVSCVHFPKIDQLIYYWRS